MLNSILLFILPQGLFGRFELLTRSDFYANNQNSVSEEAVVMANFQAGYTFTLNSLQFKPFIGINNIFNAHYSDNVRINAFGNRFFEPAPLSHFFLGFSLKD
jgi:iron complex outermembrane receptor protein